MTVRSVRATEVITPRHIDLVSLSDRFRRRLEPEGEGLDAKNQKQIARVVKLAHEFGGTLTWYSAEDSVTDIYNLEVLKNLRKTVEKIGKVAISADVKKIIMPASNQLPEARILEKYVLKDFEADGKTVSFSLQTKSYNIDWSEVAPIDPKIKTVLDKGIRGICEIPIRLRRQWDREIKENKSKCLKGKAEHMRLEI